MTNHNQHHELLRNAIEAAVGREMKSPRDFEFLSQAIFEKLSQPISTSTLKRFWGYLPQYASTRPSTLDLLAQFIDYKDWKSFCQEPATSPLPAEEATETSPAGQASQAHFPKKSWLIGIPVLLFVAILLWLVAFKGNASDDFPTRQQCILQRGQTFATSSDYLRLFGITSADHEWDQPLPHHEGIIIWGPEYHHPEWHNEGDADNMMPTITEWWAPADSTSVTGAERRLLTTARNEQLYFTVMRTNELRITFMKNLTDTCYVFLGIYRTDLQQSDSTHVVWERIADECDLSNLGYLQQLRH